MGARKFHELVNSGHQDSVVQSPRPLLGRMERGRCWVPEQFGLRDA